MISNPECDTAQRRCCHGGSDACREFHATSRRCRGNMGRMTLRGMGNMAWRYLIHDAHYNIILVMIDTNRSQFNFFGFFYRVDLG